MISSQFVLFQILPNPSASSVCILMQWLRNIDMNVKLAVHTGCSNPLPSEMNFFAFQFQPIFFLRRACASAFKQLRVIMFLHGPIKLKTNRFDSEMLRDWVLVIHHDVFNLEKIQCDDMIPFVQSLYLEFNAFVKMWFISWVAHAGEPGKSWDLEQVMLTKCGLKLPKMLKEHLRENRQAVS